MLLEVSKAVELSCEITRKVEPQYYVKMGKLRKQSHKPEIQLLVTEYVAHCLHSLNLNETESQQTDSEENTTFSM